MTHFGLKTDIPGMNWLNEEFLVVTNRWQFMAGLSDWHIIGIDWPINRTRLGLVT